MTDYYPTVDRLVLVLVAAIMTVNVCGCSAGRLPSWSGFASDPSEKHAVPWVTSWSQARDEASAQGKMMMLWFTGSDWCKYCQLLEKEVFNTQEFQDWYVGNVVPMEIDFPKKSPLPPALQEQNESLRDRYRDLVTSYPTVLFVDGDGKVLGKMGYQRGGPEAWIAEAESMLNVAW